MRPLREHQADGILALKRSLASGRKRPLLQAPTGAGKTLLSAWIVDGALRKGKRVVFVVPAIALIDQTVRAFWDEGIRDIGVIQASHSMTDPSAQVQVASVQTLARRALPECDLVIVDEAHNVFSVIGRWMAACPDLPFIGLSATPWTKGLGRLFDDLIVAATTEELIAKGFLSPFRVFAPSHPDLSKVRSVAGDYREDDLSEAMTPLVADVVTTWLQRGEGRPTLCFAVDRAHAKHLQLQFEAAGVATGYIDGNTPEPEREQVRLAFHAGELKVVCNVGVLTTGVDWDVRCIILARPTQSERLFVQIIGRGLRTAEGKADCLVLDHSDTTMRLGFVTDIHHDKLDTGRKAEAKKRERKEPLPRECPKCSCLRAAKVLICPGCGTEIQPSRGTAIDTEDGELIELDERRRAKANREVGWPEKIAFMAQLVRYAEKTNKKPGFCFYKFKDRFDVEPRDHRLRNVTAATYDDPIVLAWIRAQNIRFAKSQQRRTERADDVVFAP